MPPKDDAAPAADKVTADTAAPTDKAPAADKAPAQDKAPAAEKAADKPADQDDGKLTDDTDGSDAADDGDQEGSEAEEGEEADEERLSLDDDAEEGADKKDGKKAADADPKAEDKGKAKDKSATAWSTRRDTIVKSAEQKLLKKAKTDDEKKAAGAQVERLKKQLARYGTEEAAILAGMEAQEKLRAGQKKDKPGKDASPEDVAEWRESVGLPKESKDYDIPKIAGHQWTDADKPLHVSFKEAAFKADLTQAQVSALTEWQVAYAAEVAAGRETAIKDIDRADKKEARAILKEEFGDEFTPRLEIVDRLLKDDEALPAGLGKMLWEARSSSGQALKHHPVFLKLLAHVAMDGFGDWPGYGEGSIKTGDVREAESTRKKELQKLMRENRDEYYRTGADVEYREILAREEKSAGRGRRAA